MAWIKKLFYKRKIVRLEKSEIKNADTNNLFFWLEHCAGELSLGSGNAIVLEILSRQQQQINQLRKNLHGDN